MIDWTNAPNWAQYHAYDADGIGSWHQEEPTVGQYGFWTSTGYEWPSRYISKTNATVWFDTLEERPKEQVSA